MDYCDLESAFYFVSGVAEGEHRAVLNRKTGETFYASDMGDFEEMPEDVDENDDYVAVPHKKDLDLGKPLVMDFARQRCPELMDEVRAIFSRRGAYQNYKALLIGKGLLEAWYAFENERIKEALLEWCEDQGISLDK